MASHYLSDLFSFTLSLVHSTYISSAGFLSVPLTHPGKLPPQSFHTSVHSVWSPLPPCVHIAQSLISYICPNIIFHNKSIHCNYCHHLARTHHSLSSSLLFFSIVTYNNLTFYILLILCIVYLPRCHIDAIREGIFGHLLHCHIPSMFKNFF